MTRTPRFANLSVLGTFAYLLAACNGAPEDANAEQGFYVDPDPCALQALDALPPESTPLWKEFVTARAAGTEPELPDFSYAGYKSSDEPIPDVSAWPRFDVTAYGATPGDETYDDVGIQKAIDAAAASGGGVVWFPPGRFKLSPTSDPTQRIWISTSGIVLKGSGSGDGGTELFMDKMKKPTEALPYGAAMIEARPPACPEEVVHEGACADVRARLVADARREQPWLEVDDASGFVPGDRVALRHLSHDLKFYLQGLSPPSSWKRVRESGVSFLELHTVAEIVPSGGSYRVRLAEPIHADIRLNRDFETRIQRWNMISGVGIEDFRMVGNWASYPEPFKHLKNYDHDSGWRGVGLGQVADSWVRRIDFRDWNGPIGVGDSMTTTLSDLRLSGKLGHSSVGVSRSQGILIQDVVDEANYAHGPNVAGRASGVVYLRYKMPVNQSVDSHANGPYSNLYDNVLGGTFGGNGGTQAAFPHHGRHLVFWNFVHRTSRDTVHDFWQGSPVNRSNYVKPYFVGLQPNRSLRFTQKDELGANESFGAKAYPESLFEAQLALRRCRAQ